MRIALDYEHALNPRGGAAVHLKWPGTGSLTKTERHFLQDAMPNRQDPDPAFKNLEEGSREQDMKIDEELHALPYPHRQVSLCVPSKFDRTPCLAFPRFFLFLVSPVAVPISRVPAALSLCNPCVSPDWHRWRSAPQDGRTGVQEECRCIVCAPEDFDHQENNFYYTFFPADTYGVGFSDDETSDESNFD
jgi:hypothetical protein